MIVDKEILFLARLVKIKQKDFKMKLTLHEIAKVVGAKNDVTAYDDVAINQIEFDSRKDYSG